MSERTYTNSDTYGLMLEMPSDENAEKNVLGKIMSHDEFFTQVEDVLSIDAFRNTVNQAMYRILKYIIQHRMVVDESSIIECANKFKDKISV